MVLFQRIIQLDALVWQCKVNRKKENDDPEGLANKLGAFHNAGARCSSKA